uniref:Uncharacterized protein n=1 Tax=Arundo donax TaxID=35708 RepID=A0A0A9HLE3_ARUDO
MLVCAEITNLQTERTRISFQRICLKETSTNTTGLLL